MPGWVSLGFLEYQQRIGQGVTLELVEVAAQKRTPSRSTGQLVLDESARLLRIPNGSDRVVALDQGGAQLATEDLAQRLDRALHCGRNITCLIGGADGLSEECRSNADHVWSLSRLTLPHMLVRVIVAEQIYRAWSFLRNQPYHRGG